MFQFPAAPATGDIFSPISGVSYTFDGIGWVLSGQGVTLRVQNFSGNGVATTFTLVVDPASEVNTQVFVSGVYQQKNTYSVVGTSLVFAVAPPFGTNNIEVVLGAPPAAAAAPGAGDVPTGTLLDFAGSVAPAGYLRCDGSEISRITFAPLFAVIGSIWGAGNGTSTFNLPNFSRRVAVGDGGIALTGMGTSVGNVGGQEAVVLTAAEMPAHTHGGLTGLQSANHQHSGTTDMENNNHVHSGTTGVENANHTHAGTTDVQNANHTHGGSTSGVSADHTHSGTTGFENVAHTHNVPNVRSSASGTTQFPEGPPQFSTSALVETTQESVNHTHAFSTGGISADHTHTFGTGTESANHGHSFTSGMESSTHGHAFTTGTENLTHGHAFTTSNENTNHAHTIASAGSSGQHNNMQPSAVVLKIIKT